MNKLLISIACALLLSLLIPAQVLSGEGEGKEVAAIRRMQNLGKTQKPVVLIQRVNTLSGKIPSNLSQETSEGNTYIYVITTALQRMADMYACEPKLQTTETATALANVLIKFRGILESQNSTKYVDLPVYMNVAPPPGGWGMAGMSPNAIKDPVRRQKYLEAIEKNAQNNSKNSFHAAVNSESREVRNAVRYLLETPRIQDLITPNLYQELKNQIAED